MKFQYGAVQALCNTFAGKGRGSGMSRSTVHDGPGPALFAPDGGDNHGSQLNPVDPTKSKFYEFTSSLTKITNQFVLVTSCLTWWPSNSNPYRL